jgi:hypothetical protein
MSKKAVIKVSNDSMEDEYSITINGDVVEVKNLSVPDSCRINIQKTTDEDIQKTFRNQNWNLITSGYLD